MQSSYSYAFDGNTPYFDFDPWTSNIDSMCTLSVYNIYNSQGDLTTPTGISPTITDVGGLKRVSATVTSVSVYTFVIKVEYAEVEATHYEFTTTITFTVTCGSTAPSFGAYTDPVLLNDT